MQKYIGTAIKKDVNNPSPAGETPAVGASVTVRLQSTNAIATIYSDNGVTTISQPLITDSSGRYEFYAANDRYKIEYDYNGATTTIEDVSLLDINDVAMQNLVKATTAQALAGIDDSLYLTPKKVAVYSGFLGLGNYTPQTTTDFNSMGMANAGFYRVIGAATGKPFGNSGILMHIRRSSATQTELDGLQLYGSDGGIGYRFANDVEASTVPFLKIWSDYDIADAQNLSGATIASNATTAGSNLNPAQTGTWRNVSAVDILNNGYGLFKRV